MHARRATTVSAPPLNCGVRRTIVAWEPITSAELEKLIEAQLSACTPAEVTRFHYVRVPLRAVCIRRLGNVEQVFVVAERDGTVIYYEDVEEGFNLSAIDA